MSVLACLDRPPPPPDELMMADGYFNVVIALLLLSVALVAVLSPLVRRAYRKRVLRLMALNQVQPRPDGWWEALGITSARQVSPRTAPVAPETLAAEATAWERRLTLATLAGWLVFALAAVPVAAWSNPATGGLGQFEFAAMAALLAVGPALVNIPQRWFRRALMVWLAVIVLAAGLYEVFAPTEPELAPGDGDDDWETWLETLSVIGVAALYAALFHHRWRGQVLSLIAVAWVLILTFTLPLGLLEPYLGSCLSLEPDAANTANIGEQQFWSGAYAVIGGTLAMLGLWLGLLALGGLARLVEQGWLGELSMVSVIGLGVIAFGMVFGNIPEDATDYPLWVGWLPLPWLAVTVAAYSAVLRKRPLGGPGQPLLLLRVFSKDKRHQKLLRSVQERWRYVGAVQQAGGPDMLDLNVDPYESAMFLSSRLHELFLPEAVSRERLLSRLNTAPDREGRYRINEMFNFNSAWRQNVEQLILASNTILLDVRGLTAQREGTSFEIGLLAKHALLDRVIAVGDETTDWELVNSQLRNHGQDPDRLKTVDLASDKGLHGLFEELLKIAARSA